MSDFAVVRAGVVTNVVVWDGESEWNEPIGAEAIEVTEATGPAVIGGTWNGTTFEPPFQPPLDATEGATHGAICTPEQP